MMKGQALMMCSAQKSPEGIPTGNRIPEDVLTRSSKAPTTP